MRTKSNTLQSLETITEHGGHLVLVRRGAKAPVWSKWQSRKPALDVVAAHDGRIGLIPHSIGATALDLDHGSILPTCQHLGPNTGHRDATVGTSTMATINRDEIRSGELVIARARYAGRMAT